MGKYIVELTDEKGSIGCIQVSLPFRKVGTYKKNSTWRVLDENFLKVRSGTCEIRFADMLMPYGVNVPPLHLLLVSGEHWGVSLLKFTDNWTFVEESGNGEVVQPWAGHCNPGKITWSLLT